MDNAEGNENNILSLLYQSGYLSIDGNNSDGQTYRLVFPNEEVRNGFFQFLMPYYAKVQDNDTASEVMKFLDDIRGGRVEQMMTRLQSLFADFQYDAQDESEAHFRNVLYIFCKLIGLQVKAEYMTSDGRIDLLIQTDMYIYIIECKINSTANTALEQIKRKEYVLPWTLDKREKILIGVNFSTKSRKPNEWIVERGDGSVLRSNMKNVSKNVSKKIQDRRAKIIELVRNDSTITIAVVAKLCNVSEMTVYRDLYDMPKLRHLGPKNGGYWEIIE